MKIKNIKYIKTNKLNFFLPLVFFSQLLISEISIVKANENKENNFNKLPDKSSVIKEFKKGRLNPFENFNSIVKNKSNIEENKINLLGIMSSKNKQIALFEYEGNTYKLCLGIGGKCNKNQDTIIPNEWEILSLDDKQMCFDYSYKFNDDKNIKSICQ
tara:strand:+ start:1236 stop:1709 length:474 start_codon:yes stop_codon:yes gene_type:complete